MLSWTDPATLVAHQFFDPFTHLFGLPNPHPVTGILSHVAIAGFDGLTVNEAGIIAAWGRCLSGMLGIFTRNGFGGGLAAGINPNLPSLRLLVVGLREHSWFFRLRRILHAIRGAVGNPAQLALQHPVLANHLALAPPGINGVGCMCSSLSSIIHTLTGAFRQQCFSSGGSRTNTSCLTLFEV